MNVDELDTMRLPFQALYKTKFPIWVDMDLVF